MYQLFGRLDSKTNNPHEQKNHGVHFVSGVSLETLQSCPLDGLDLLLNDAKTFHVPLKRRSCVGWQRNSLGCSDSVQLLARLTQHWIEVTHTKLDQDRFHPVDRAGPFLDQ
jgi:hypothetical protein